MVLQSPKLKVVSKEQSSVYGGLRTVVLWVDDSLHTHDGLHDHRSLSTHVECSVRLYVRSVESL